jgi:putative oxidoreductase
VGLGTWNVVAMSNRHEIELRDVGLLALRLGFGAVMMAHGAQKQFGAFGGHGIGGTGAFFEQVGFRPGRVNAHIAAASELGGGALLALGLATPAAGAAAAGTMLVAGSISKEQGFFAQEGGVEYQLVLALVGGALALTGSGRLSLDHGTRHVFDKPWMRVFAAALVVPTAAFVMARRDKALARAEAQAQSVASPVE